MKSCLNLCVVAVVLFLAASVICIEPTPRPEPKLQLTVSPEITFFTEPVGEDGFINYVAAVDQHFRKGVTPENNAIIPLLKVFGVKDVPEDIRPEFFKKLGIKPLPETGLFVNPGKFSDEVRQEYDRALQKPWKQADCPRISKWLNDNTKALQLIDQASRRPNLYLPLISPATKDERSNLINAYANITILDIGQFVSPRLLLMRANRSIANGRFQDAINDFLTIHRLARLINKNGFLSSSFVGTMIERTSDSRRWQFAFSQKLSSAEALTYLLNLKKLGPLHGVAEKSRVLERCFELDATLWFVQIYHRDRSEGMKFSEYAGFLPGNLKGSFEDHFDAEILFRRLNEIFDRFYQVASLTEPLKRRAAIRDLKQTFRDFKTRSRQFPDYVKRVRQTAANRRKSSIWLAESLYSAMAESNTVLMTWEDDANAHYDLTCVVLAMAAYQAERGEYPTELAKLVPRYISELPIDRFNGKPLQYSLTKNRYLLYSSGRNGKDDKGEADDIVVRYEEEIPEDSEGRPFGEGEERN